MKAHWLLRWLVALTGGAVTCAVTVWVVLWISMRSSVTRVPDLQGMELSHAAAVLQESGLVARLQEGVFDAEVPPGKVASQRPQAGFQLKRGASVVLHPSLGKEAVKVGELVGLPVSLATAELESEHLKEGRDCEVEGQADAAVVLAQTPPAGSLAAPGSGVDLLVNRVPRQVRYIMPDFVGQDEKSVSRAIRALGFRLAEVQRVPYVGVPPGVVLRQDPEAGGPVADAAVVGLWVSL
jgi:eukaryotic-like serine/threonine-protein kinase